MARAERNIPIDHKWHDTTSLGVTAKPHSFVDGEYVEETYIHQEYPKFKYHADYVHDRKDGVDYSFTQLPQLVRSPDEEDELGGDWKDSPGEAGVVTAPDAEHAAKQKKRLAAAGANWRAALPNANPDVTEVHLRFVQAAGASDVKTMADLYTFLAGMSGQQMRSFMAEAIEWEKAQHKGKK